MNFLHIVQIIGFAVFLLTALFNIGLWACGTFRLPQYVHWIAAVAFLLGGLLSYEVVLLGKSVVSTLWFPFVFAALVYFLFIAHGAGSPSKEDWKWIVAELKEEALDRKEAEGTKEEDEEWQEPRVETRGSE